MAVNADEKICAINIDPGQLKYQTLVSEDSLGNPMFKYWFCGVEFSNNLGSGLFFLKLYPF